MFLLWCPLNARYQQYCNRPSFPWSQPGSVFLQQCPQLIDHREGSGRSGWSACSRSPQTCSQRWRMASAQLPLDLGVWMPMLLCSHPPFLRIVNTHAKLPRASFHAPANHEAVTWLEDMKRTRHGGVSHGAHKDRHILRQTVERETFCSGS